MKLIGITPESNVDDEAVLIANLLDAGIDEMHIRKPTSPVDAVARLLQDIPEPFHARLILHEHFDLTHRFGIGGIHLNRRNSHKPTDYHGKIGRSCHTLDEVAHSVDTDYCFLSPIYNSISKVGYMARFTDKDLEQAACDGIIGPHVYALGGITPHNLPQLQRYGFGGAAFLGYLWNDLTLHNLPERVYSLRSVLTNDNHYNQNNF